MPARAALAWKPRLVHAACLSMWPRYQPLEREREREREKKQSPLLSRAINWQRPAESIISMFSPRCRQNVCFLLYIWTRDVRFNLREVTLTSFFFHIWRFEKGHVINESIFPFLFPRNRIRRYDSRVFKVVFFERSFPKILAPLYKRARYFSFIKGNFIKFMKRSLSLYLK